MSRRFRYYLKVVALAHGLVVLVIVLGSGWKRFFRPRPRILMPVEFMVEVPAREEKPDTPVTPAPPPEPEPEAVPPPQPRPRPRPKKKPISRSTKRVVRTAESAKLEKVLSEEQIRKLLERGVKAGNHTRLPDSDTLSLEQIRLAFYNAWEQPGREETDGRTVRAEISLAADGRITGRRVVDESGIAVMDTSVMRALNAVTRVEGLTADFVRRYPSVTIAFKVE